MISDAMRSLVEELVLRPDAPAELLAFNAEMAHLSMDNGESVWLLHTPDENLYHRLHEFFDFIGEGYGLCPGSGGHAGRQGLCSPGLGEG